MDNTNNTQNPVDVTIADKTIIDNTADVIPTTDETVVEAPAMTETAAEEAVNGDQPVEGGVINMNEEDEEADKEAPIV